MFKVKVLLFSLFIFQSLHSQKSVVSGYVEDINTGERIIGAYVKDTISKSVVQTNGYGFYTIKSDKEEMALQSTFIGLKSEVIRLFLKHDTLVNIQMKPVMELQEVLIESSAYKHNVNTTLGLTTIPVRQLTSIPALGESDLLKAIQSQPGVKGGIEGSAGIFVRGGSLGENLFMLDDVPLYNVSHLYGFLSIFNSAIIKDIKLMKGCFPAQYGGRTSSVIDVRGRDGNNNSIKGEISVGLISSSINIEGPLFNDKTTFIISGRRSYFDLYSEALRKSDLLDKDFPDYYFYDLSARIAHTFSPNDKIYLNIYKGRDHIRNNSESSMLYGISEILTESVEETSGWGNLLGSLRWNHSFGKGIFANTTISVSSYDYFTLDKYNSTRIDSLSDKALNKKYIASYKSNISDLIVKTDFDYSLSNYHKLLFGIGGTFHTIKPGESHYSMKDDEIKEEVESSYLNKLLYPGEFYIYLDDEIKASEKLDMDIGLRVTGFVSGSKGYINPEPRFSANYSLTHDLSLKIGYSRMVQYLHLLSTSGLTMPTDIWVPSSDGLNPLKSDQINAGLSYDFHGIVLLTIEAYRKWLNNTTDFKNGASLLSDTSPWFEKTTQGIGNAKGIELSLEKQEGHFTGAISYTLSTSDRKYAALNYGNAFPFRYHRLHDFNVSVNYKIFKKWDLSALWSYGTGYPVTVPVEEYRPTMEVVHQFVFYYPSINNYRLPDYHRLDLGIHYRSVNRLGENYLSFDLFNAYNRKNVINMYVSGWDFKYSYLLPFIPSVTYTLKF